MAVRVCLIIVFCAAVPAWSQLGTNTSDAEDISLSDSTGMQTPPPVNEAAYPIEIPSEARSNFLRAGLILTSSYVDNVLQYTSGPPTGDTYYSIVPTITFDHTSPRLHQTLTYRPGFTFYQHATSLNEVDQSLTAHFQYLLSPHMTLSIGEAFYKSSNAFSQPYGLPGGPVTGSTQSSLVPVLAPVADQLNNSTILELTYHLSRNGMIGVSGAFTRQSYSNPGQVVGLSNSNSRGGAVFYSYRLSKTRYLGVTYAYSQAFSSLPPIDGGPQTAANSDTRTHAVILFLTTYVTPNFSFSLSAGPQHYHVTESPAPPMSSWTPALTVSTAWQGRRAGFAVRYSHSVGGGGGLQGAFDSNSASASAQWLLARNWPIGFGASYANNTNVSQVTSEINPGGRQLSAGVSVQHSFTDHCQMALGYMRLSQSYPYITAVSNSPDVNREFVSVSYSFTRPLGR